MIASTLLCLSRAQHLAETTIDVAAEYSATFEGISKAMAKATAVLGSGSSCTLFFSAGVHHIEMPATLFNVTRLSPAGSGAARLTIAGAGMLATTLNLTTHGHDVIHGATQTRHFTVRDITFARPQLTTTQGTLVAADETSVRIKIDPRFPPPTTLLVDRIGRLSAEQGLYLRRYRTGFADGAHVVVDAAASAAGGSGNMSWPPRINGQVRFACGGDGERCPAVKPVGDAGGGVWELAIPSWGTPGGGTKKGDLSEMKRYQADIGVKGAIVGIKVKHGGQAFNIRHCEDVAFESVRWLGHSRGILQNCTSVALRNTRVERSPDPPYPLAQALATPGGGPQVNTCANLTVFNHTSVGTGDDALGLFHIESGSVTGCKIRDSFARGILLCRVSDTFAVNVRGNEVVRCPVWRPPANVHVNTC